MAGTDHGVVFNGTWMRHMFGSTDAGAISGGLLINEAS